MKTITASKIAEDISYLEKENRKKSPLLLLQRMELFMRFFRIAVRGVNIARGGLQRLMSE